MVRSSTGSEFPAFNREVGSSSLPGPTRKHSSMAERLFVKERAECSNHSVSANGRIAPTGRAAV